MNKNQACDTLKAVIVQQVLHEFREGRDPIVTYEIARDCLEALGCPLALGTVKDLPVETQTFGGKSAGFLSRFHREGVAYVKRRLARPNLKAQAAAKARAARRAGAPA